MTTRAHSIRLSADDEGIIFTAIAVGGHQAVYRLRFDDRILEQLGASKPKLRVKPLIIYGVLGYIDYGTGFLVVITQRSEVTTIHNRKVYKITEILSIPLVPQKCRQKLREYENNSEDDNEDDPDIDLNPSPSLNDPTADLTPQDSSETESIPISDSCIVEDVLLKTPAPTKWVSWFRRHSTVYTEDPARDPTTKDPKKHHTVSEESVQDIELKLLRVLDVLFTKKSCYFSYDLDLSRSLVEAPLESDIINISKQEYYFNRCINRQFKDTLLEMPVLQGFIGGINVPVKDKDTNAWLYLISRRSVHRAGVRYLKRGIDEKGYCANWIETEQLLVVEQVCCYSYTLVRGSIPVYFSQSPYRLQPIPQLHRTRNENENAFKLHFERLAQAYGDVIAISLVEKPPSREAPLGQLYQDLCSENNVPLEWFDFHKQCKGMKFENVERLFKIPQVLQSLEKFGWTQNSHQKHIKQSGVFRVNCVDCLDRTNVVQRSCAERILSLQLADAQLQLLDEDSHSRRFNELWADNGDSISKQYSSTNALKGDFTRTQKRNLIGVLNDAYLTVSRYFHGAVSDFFTQAVLDYLTGNATKDVFLEFEQSLVRRQSVDIYSESMKDNAINVSTGIMTNEDELVYGSWWVQTTRARFQPQNDTMNIKELMYLDDCILLITNKFIGICYFDFALEKITDYYKIEPSAVKKIQMGPYFTDTLTKASSDPDRNQGLYIVYSSDGLNRAEHGGVGDGPWSSGVDLGIAIKLPMRLDRTPKLVLDTLKRTCTGAEVIFEPIVTLKQAQLQTSIWDTLEYRLKRTVWV